MRIFREADVWIRRNYGILTAIVCRPLCMKCLLFLHAILTFWCTALLLVDVTGSLELAWLSFMQKQSNFERNRIHALLDNSRMQWQREHCHSRRLQKKV